MGENWQLRQDGASVHRSKLTVASLKERNVSVLTWPAKSPDLNIIENAWGILARMVYKDGRHFDNVEELVEAVASSWENIDLRVH